MAILFMGGLLSPAKLQPPSHQKDSGLLPLIDPRVTARRRDEIKRARLAVTEKWVHVVPVLIFLVFFLLWWFSRPVSGLELMEFLNSSR